MFSLTISSDGARICVARGAMRANPDVAKD